MSKEENGRKARPYQEKRNDHQTSPAPKKNIPLLQGQGGDKQPSRPTGSPSLTLKGSHVQSHGNEKQNAKLQGNPLPAEKVTSVPGQRGNKQHSKLPGSPAVTRKVKVTPMDGQGGDKHHAKPPGNPTQTEKVSSVDGQGGEEHHAKEVRRLKIENQYLKTIMDHFHRNILLGEITPEQELKPPKDIQNEQSILELYSNAQRLAQKYHELERRMSQSSFTIAGGEEGGENPLQDSSNKNTAAGRNPEKSYASTPVPSEHTLDSVSLAPKERNEKESNREDLSNHLEESSHSQQHMEVWDDHQKFSDSSDKNSAGKGLSDSKAHPREKKRDVSQSVHEVQILIKRQEDEITKLRSDLEEAEENSRKSQFTERKKLEEEVKSLRMRLSELAGAKFSKDNPDVTDLSDPNRPTKLAEQYSELYSSEWTDCYQQMSESKSDFSEEKAIKYLLDILLEGFKYCKSIKDLQHEGLREIIFFPARDKETQFQVNEESDKMNEVFARHLTDAVKLCGEMTGKHIAKVFIERKETKKILRKEIDNHILYAQKCVQLCWLMQVQNPPVCIDLSAKSGDQFDKNTFVEYTKKGSKIDFIVWPPLRLSNGGPLLAKGVAQGK